MDFDKCEDGFEDEPEEYLQINQEEPNFVHFDSSNNDQEIMFVNNAQLHTYIINNREQTLQEPPNMLVYSNHNGIEKQIKGDGANNDSSLSKINIDNENDIDEDEDDDDEVLLYDTQL